MRSIRGCPCAVIGGAGFLGSHLVDFLLNDRDCSVLVVDNLIAGRREFLPVSPKVHFEHHDITGSEEHLLRLFREYGTRFVFQYASRPYVPDSYARPLRTFDVNAMGALKVMNAAQEAGCEGVLQVSSAEIFGDVPGLGDSLVGSNRIDEDDPVRPHSTYGAAKAAIDYLVQVRWREAKTPCIALRQFNCIGERDICHPYVVPEIARQLEAQIEPAICTACYTVRTGDDVCSRCNNTFVDPDFRAKVSLGNNSFRDFLYAGDQARMATELLEKGEFGSVYNLGSQDGIQIYDLARLIGKLMGFGRINIEEDPARKRAWEIWWLKADCTKLYSVINARPQVSLEEALRRTINYFRETGWRFAW